MKDILKHYSKYILLDTLVAATLFAGAIAFPSEVYRMVLLCGNRNHNNRNIVGHISIIAKNTKELCEICSNMC